MDVSEKNVEAAIEAVLTTPVPLARPVKPPTGDRVAEPAPRYGDPVPGGYQKRLRESYDKALCLIPEDVIAFVYATQPKEWAKLEKQYGTDAKGRLLQRLKSEIEKRGTPDVLRKGVKCDGCTFRLAYFPPVSGLNPELQRLYEANLFSVVRQLHYSDKNTKDALDLAIFLNGIPIFTAELKNPLTGQTVKDAMHQYRHDRDPAEPLFQLGRCLAHYAVDPDLVYMTTHLRGPKTRFLPFNRGRRTGAGNPPSARGFATAYLWERTWTRESVLDLIEHFVHVVEEEDENGKKTGEKSLLFPRYHQLDAVRRLVADARAEGAGQRYLIEHSAGSGKSNSIAWLAHQLATLHGTGDRPIFDSVIVITDRRVLDRQLQRTVRQFEQTLGMVENIDQGGKHLKAALEEGKRIIVTTLQKFPVIVNEIGAIPGKRFAVIIDEAHSSQSGESTKSLKAVLSAKTLEEAEEEEGREGEDLEDRIAAEMKKRGRLPNVSFYAFTATPKPKTLELFGTPAADGSFEPFSLYSMRQAIEENFILDVLENYTTYKSYWSLLKKVEDDPRYDRKKATFLLKSFVDLHEHTIQKKVAIMVEHFVDHVRKRIGGKAKAMVVTRSRLHAVRYKLAIDAYLKERGYAFQALVAFSGTVHDGGVDYTEAGMNGFPESQTAKMFRRDENRILVVAEKFQTGFDEPLLHTMYVDKKLAGVNAVQTLSRLNRTHPEKPDTIVIDFANEADDIQKAFEPYYEKTLLTGRTDPNLLYDGQTRLAGFHYYDPADIDRVAEVWFQPGATQAALHPAIDPVVARVLAAPEDERTEFRSYLDQFVRLYAFLSQVITFTDIDLEKLYVFGRVLLRKLPVARDRLPVDVQEAVDMDSYRLQKTKEGRISLTRGKPELDPMADKPVVPSGSNEKEPLSRILNELNKRFGTDFTGDDKVFIQQLESRLADDPALAASFKVNTPENARLTFEQVVNDRLQEMIDANFKFYREVTDREDFRHFFVTWLFDRYRKKTA